MSSRNTPAIELDGVTKQYDDIVAINDVDLSVEKGEIFGFLGPNGAGKTTTINLLLDFVRPTGGEIHILGHDVQDEGQQIRKRMGVLPEDAAVYDRLTGRQHIAFAIESKDADDTPEQILERVGLTEAIDRKAGGYSKGMAQRLLLGMALVGTPDVLILDEPSTGLDPNGAHEMREIVREEAARGATVFFSSHILGQVESVCDRVGILRDGTLVAKDTIDGLREAATTETTLTVKVDRVSDAALNEVHDLSGVSDITVDDNILTITCEDTAKTQVLNTLEKTDTSVQDFMTEDTSLEEVFMTYTEKTEVTA
jgi:ABC-2 type transport system ATP-binding protein